MAEKIKVNELETASSLKDNDRVLALTDEENNEVKTVSKQNVITSLISTAENNLLTNNGGLYVDGSTITALIEVLSTIQAQQADEIGRPIFTLSNTLLDNEIWLEGATVSREQYAQLFEIYGETYGAGDGSTTFKLPDFRNRTIWGASNFGYIEAGLPNITGEVQWTGNGRDVGYYQTKTGCFSNSYRGGFGNGQQYSNGYVINFNASKSNSIYKDDCNTVQPPAIKVRVKTRFE